MHQSIFIAGNVTHCPFFRFDDDFWYPEGPYKGKIADFKANSGCELFTVLQIFCVKRAQHSSNKLLQCSMGPRLSKKCCSGSQKCKKHSLLMKTQVDGHFFMILMQNHQNSSRCHQKECFCKCYAWICGVRENFCKDYIHHHECLKSSLGS